MKTTFDLPEDLVRQLKLRAVREGKKLKDVAADFLRDGLTHSRAHAEKAAPPRITRDKKTGLPVIQTRRRPQRELTPDDLAAILSDQENAWATGKNGAMILADTNVWLSLAISSHSHHALAQNWFAAQSKAKSIFFCRLTQLSFLRLLTTAKVMGVYGELPLTNAAAWTIFEGFHADRRITWLDEPKNLDAQWKLFASRGTSSPKLWMDAYLAAFALVGNHQLVTTDHAFSHFVGLNALILS